MKKEQSKVQKLNDLIQMCKDSEHGLRQAAAEVHNKEHRTLLLDSARRRAEFASQLQEEVRKLGAKPEKYGSTAGTVHRGWMNVRYQMNLHHDQVVLEECLRGEEVALKMYEDIFEYKVLPELEPLLHDQFVHVIEMRDLLAEIVHPGKKKLEGTLLRL
jgi:uncharacterized protein (TIGR02284 family)